ncbi:MAG: sigma-70 family RNA polymerase sigma factor [Opitutales bacterium]|jgi:RNA polymerase sigma factor (sigma-70 family)
MTDDAELLRQYAHEHSQAAFAELVQRRLDLVFCVALRQVGGDAHLAEDVTQKVFADLARKAAALATHPALSGWLYRSAQFAATDVVRAERRRRVREQEAQTMHEISSDPGAQTDWETLRPMLDRLLGELDECDRNAVALRFFEGRPFADIGQALRLTEEAARKRVERALDRLHSRLAQRGVTSTTAALAVALGNQVYAAAPAGLAARVVASALAGATAGGTAAGLALLTFMNTTKITLGVTAAIALLAVGGALFEAHEAGQISADLALANQQRDALDTKLHRLEQQLQAATARAQTAEADSAHLPKAAQPPAADTASNGPITHDTVAARFAHAQELAKNGDYAGALAEFLWCYNQGMPQVPDYRGVRDSFLLSDIADLGKQYPAALDALRDLRDQAKYRILNDTNDVGAVQDFSSLNTALNDDSATMDLFNQMGPTDPRRAAVGLGVYNQLVANQDYSDAAQVISYQKMNTMIDAMTAPSPDGANLPAQARQIMQTTVVTTAANYVEVLAGTGDVQDARALADKVLNYDNSDDARAILQSHAARAGQPDLLSPQP